MRTLSVSPPQWNAAHALCDDAFGIFYLLKTFLGWTEAESYAWTASGRPPAAALGMQPLPSPPAPPPSPGANGSAAAVAAASPPLQPSPPPMWGILYNDFRAVEDPPELFALFTRLFPNVRLYAPLRFGEEFGVSQDKPLLCFRRAVMGPNGYSMFRNGAYANNVGREWPRWVGFDAARYLAMHETFADFLAGAVGRPPRAVAAAAAAAAGTLGTVVVIQRDVPPGGVAKRVIRNFGDMWMDLHVRHREAVGGRRIVKHNFGNITADVDVMRGADLVIAVHGAGTMNLWFMRPGSAWIDLLPPRAVQYQPVMLALAQRFGVRFFTQPLLEINVSAPEPHDHPYYNVHPGAVASLASLVLGAEP